METFPPDSTRKERGFSPRLTQCTSGKTTIHGRLLAAMNGQPKAEQPVDA
jgi:hypothetical protein